MKIDAFFKEKLKNVMSTSNLVVLITFLHLIGHGPTYKLNVKLSITIVFQLYVFHSFMLTFVEIGGTQYSIYQ